MTFLSKIEQAKQLIKEYAKKYPKCAVAISGGKDSGVLFYLIREVASQVPSFTVLSNTEFPETIQTIIKMAPQTHFYYFKNDPKKGSEDCCRTPKVEMFKEAVRDLDMWFSGIRRNEGITRANFDYVEDRNGLIKVNPLLDWTELDIWRFTALYEIPVNPMYKEGYRSLSCSKCSAKEEDEKETERAGRWRGTKNAGFECGIHSVSLKDLPNKAKEINGRQNINLRK